MEETTTTTHRHTTKREASSSRARTKPSKTARTHTMGKASKKRRSAARYDPLARPSDMRVDGEDVEPAKQLSAHQQRHLERKRLQAEKVELKNQKRKVILRKIKCWLEKAPNQLHILDVAQVSKADKLTWKKETKVRTV